MRLSARDSALQHMLHCYRATMKNFTDPGQGRPSPAVNLPSTCGLEKASDVFISCHLRTVLLQQDLGKKPPRVSWVKVMKHRESAVPASYNWRKWVAEGRWRSAHVCTHVLFCDVELLNPSERGRWTHCCGNETSSRRFAALDRCSGPDTVVNLLWLCTHAKATISEWSMSVASSRKWRKPLTITGRYLHYPDVPCYSEPQHYSVLVKLTRSSISITISKQIII